MIEFQWCPYKDGVKLCGITTDETHLEIPPLAEIDGDVYKVLSLEISESVDTVEYITIPGIIFYWEPKQVEGFLGSLRKFSNLKNIEISHKAIETENQISNETLSIIKDLIFAIDGVLFINSPGTGKILMQYPIKKEDKSYKVPFGTVKIYSEAFKNSTVLEQIDLPLGIEEIGNWAFDGTGIKQITLPNTLVELGACAFNFCEELEDVDMSRCKKLHDIRINTFCGCQKLKTVKLPPELKNIETMAFLSTKSLSSIEIPSSIETIGLCAFGLSGLKEIEIHSNNFNISWDNLGLANGVSGIYVFEKCQNLARIKISGKANRITPLASECPNLAEIDLSECEIETLGIPQNEVTKEMCSDTTHLFLLIVAPFNSGLKTVKLPESIKRIGAYSMMTYEGSDFTIPCNVTEIDKFAFSKSNITNIYLPASVERVGDSCFSGCMELKKVTAASDCIQYGLGVFNDCPKLISTPVTGNSTTESVNNVQSQECANDVEAEEEESSMIKYVIYFIVGLVLIWLFF